MEDLYNNLLVAALFSYLYSFSVCHLQKAPLIKDQQCKYKQLETSN